MRIALVSDAWHPQVNGVVRTLARIKQELESEGHEIEVISPDRFRSMPCPTYPEIRLALFPGRDVTRILDTKTPQAIHIATEGPLGIAARRYCLKRNLGFTSSFHTRFPEYLHARTRFPTRLAYDWMRRFHARSAGCLVATESMRKELSLRGFDNLKPWSRGVDSELFRPREDRLLDLPGPIFLYVGRVAVEKNIGAFLDLDLPGSKVVVGDGPQIDDLRRRYPQVVFTGAKFGEELAQHFASAQVFVFPSRTDTFGLVLLEALAAGVPVAAYPVPGPLDIVGNSGVGVLHEDLALAARQALHVPRERCREHALTFSWPRCAKEFLDNLSILAPRGAGIASSIAA